ncbi:MAG: insulinase family protein [Leptospirales bacterium]|nr:insulinase family protein [Leptospirales bacterium]
MKSRILLLALGAVLAIWPAAAERQGLLDGLQFPPMQFQAPQIERRNLAGGQVQWLAAPDSSLPFFTLSFNFSGGLDRERIGEAGLLQSTLQMLDQGGAGDLDGAARSALLGRLGGSIGFDAGYSSWSVSIRFLKKDYAEAMRLLREALLNPRFPEEELPVIQRGLLSAIERRNDRPESVAARRMNELLYPGLRRGYSLQAANVQSLSVAAMRAELRRRLSRQSMVIASAGDWSGLPLAADLESLLQKLPTANELPPPEAGGMSELLRRRPAADPYRNRILLVDTPAAQAVIALGAYLPQHASPQFYALQTGNYILGGGSFNSRLMREIRVQRGLAYYAYSYNDFGARDGEFNAGSATRNSQAADTLRLMLQMIPELSRGVSQSELKLAQDSILNGFAFQFSTPEETVSNELRFLRDGLPPNYLQQFPAQIRAVRSEQIAESAQLLQAENLFVVVAGPAALKAELEKIRPVVVVQPETPLYVGHSN